ncbi:MAG: hypothetical protein WAX69_25350, partial [Victivallales bacterium]
SQYIQSHGQDAFYPAQNGQNILNDFRAVRISQMTFAMSGIEQFVYAFQLLNSEPMLACLIIGILFREFALKYLHV